MALIIELFLIGVGLSMDAFAVSICKGLGMEKINKKQAFTIGLYFGGFQALMPLIGWFLGIRFQQYITSIDHWIAFILLVCIGGKMVVEAVRDRDHEVVGKKDQPLDHKEMFLLAVATSIDALAVGITFALLDTPIIEAIVIIGCTTFVLSIVGVIVGNFFGTRYKKKAEIIGGIILILIFYLFYYQPVEKTIAGCLALLWEAPACFAFLSINLYNHQRGRGHSFKYFF